MTRKGKWPGTWATICDRCGFRFPSNELKPEWTGLMVCGQCWEPRHPQDFVKAIPDEQAPPWTRPNPEPIYVGICYLEGLSCYTGLAVTGCSIAGNQQFTAEFLLGLSTGTP